MSASTSGLYWLRRTGRWLVAVGIVVLLDGCASLGVSVGADALYSAMFRIKIEEVSKLEPDELDNVRSVLLFASGQGLEATDKGPVVGLACKLSVAPLIPQFFWYPPLSDDLAPSPVDAARLQLKIKAVRAGGNAIIEPVCTHHDGIDWPNNCFESWICKGRAVWIRVSERSIRTRPGRLLAIRSQRGRRHLLRQM
jgi:hypothetical protein